MELGEVAAMAGILGAVGGVALYIVRGELRGDVTRLDGRINSHERECAERQKRLDERHVESNKKLDHIVEKLDQLMGAQ